MPVPSLLAVFAHPDDESLSAGGVLGRGARCHPRCQWHLVCHPLGVTTAQVHKL
ncbi:hypothetical protein ACIQUU_32305 [Streptomyces sp. NPDC101116]|uniref:hypothetical protein n=1 Tax=Streptomyces sp. NPDC101116 TaxID=3366107 RepID=UPI0037F53E87